ncbi:MAG: hypothetical protein QG657_5680, partial [Acidobacteriota bacterium]|nr:hypothetical protein [Acidobacteriota bacterium]
IHMKACAFQSFFCTNSNEEPENLWEAPENLSEGPENLWEGPENLSEDQENLWN